MTLQAFLYKYFPNESLSVGYNRLLQMVEDLYALSECFDKSTLVEELNFIVNSTNILNPKVCDLPTYTDYMNFKKLEQKYTGTLMELAIKQLLNIGISCFQDTSWVQSQKDRILLNKLRTASFTSEYICTILSCAEDIAHNNCEQIIKYIKREFIV